MEKDFDYKKVPHDYVHCLNTSCPRSADCLRFKIGTIADKNTPYFRTVNPAYRASTDECKFFVADKLVRYACGINHLYDGLLHTSYIIIKEKIHNYFGHTQYYRIRNKARLITPKDQAVIRNIFLKEGIKTEPVYDEYIEEYNFIRVRI